MGKVLLFKMDDGSVKYCHPSKKYLGGVYTFVRDDNGNKIPQLDGSGKVMFNDRKQVVWQTRELTLDDMNLEGTSVHGKPFIVVEDDQVPVISTRLGTNQENMYFEGDGAPTLETLRVDTNWEKMLMPVDMIYKKHVDRINTKIDAELEKDNGDIKLALQLQREKEVFTKASTKEIYQKAIENIQADGLNKPIAVQKINEKIAAIEAAELEAAEDLSDIEGGK